MRKIVLLAALAAFLPLHGASAATKQNHEQYGQVPAQQEDDPSDKIAQAGEDVVNVIVNVGRTTSRAITHLFDDDAPAP